MKWPPATRFTRQGLIWTNMNAVLLTPVFFQLYDSFIFNSANLNIIHFLIVTHIGFLHSSSEFEHAASVDVIWLMFENLLCPTWEEKTMDPCQGNYLSESRINSQINIIHFSNMFLVSCFLFLCFREISFWRFALKMKTWKLKYQVSILMTRITSLRLSKNMISSCWIEYFNVLSFFTQWSSRCPLGLTPT